MTLKEVVAETIEKYKSLEQTNPRDLTVSPKLEPYLSHLLGDIAPDLIHPKLIEDIEQSCEIGVETGSLAHQAAWYLESQILPLFDFLLEQHRQNPSFLGHVFIGERGRRGFRALEEDGTLSYTTGKFYEFENALSIHPPSGTIIGDNSYAAIPGPGPDVNPYSEERHGTVVFNEKFYDEICSPSISDENLEELLTRLNYFSTCYIRHFSELGARLDSIGHSERAEVFERMETQVRELALLIPYVFGVKTEDFIHQRLGDWNGIPTIKEAVKTVIGARDYFVEVDFMGNDSGVRAVTIDLENGLTALPIKPSHIKYLIKHKETNIPEVLKRRGYDESYLENEIGFQIVLDNS